MVHFNVKVLSNYHDMIEGGFTSHSFRVNRDKRLFELTTDYQQEKC